MKNKIQLQTLTIIRFNLLVRAARKVKEEQDILSLPGIKLGNPVSPKTVNLVINFYLNDEFSKMMPRKKDFVSIRRTSMFKKGYYYSILMKYIT